MDQKEHWCKNLRSTVCPVLWQAFAPTVFISGSKKKKVGMVLSFVWILYNLAVWTLNVGTRRDKKKLPVSPWGRLEEPKIWIKSIFIWKKKILIVLCFLKDIQIPHFIFYFYCSNIDRNIFTLVPTHLLLQLLDIWKKKKRNNLKKSGIFSNVVKIPTMKKKIGIILRKVHEAENSY